MSYGISEADVGKGIVNKERRRDRVKGGKPK